MLLGALAVLGPSSGRRSRRRGSRHTLRLHRCCLLRLPSTWTRCPATSPVTSPSTRKQPWSTPSDAIQQVLTDVGLDDASALRDSVSVTAPANSRVLDITVRGPDARKAVRIADRLSAAYLSVRAEYLEQRANRCVSSSARSWRSPPGAVKWWRAMTPLRRRTCARRGRDPRRAPGTVAHVDRGRRGAETGGGETCPFAGGGADRLGRARWERCSGSSCISMREAGLRRPNGAADRGGALASPIGLSGRARPGIARHQIRWAPMDDPLSPALLDLISAAERLWPDAEEVVLARRRGRRPRRRRNRPGAARSPRCQSTPGAASGPWAGRRCSCAALQRCAVGPRGPAASRARRRADLRRDATAFGSDPCGQPRRGPHRGVAGRRPGPEGLGQPGRRERTRQPQAGARGVRPQRASCCAFAKIGDSPVSASHVLSEVRSLEQVNDRVLGRRRTAADAGAPERGVAWRSW